VEVFCDWLTAEADYQVAANLYLSDDVKLLHSELVINMAK